MIQKNASYDLEEVARELKAAREARDLSQRDLSGLAGVPQGHLSKVEKGLVDLRLSSLIQIARALDLELKLVPKKALPAVDTLIRSTIKQGPDPATRTAWEQVGAAQEAVAALKRIFPNLDQLNRTQTVLLELGRIAFPPESLKPLSQALKPYRRFNKVLANFERMNESLAPAPHTWKQLRVLDLPQREMLESFAIPELSRLAERTQHILASTDQLQRLRNRIVHEMPRTRSGRAPAYRLDDEDEEDDDA